MKYPKQETIRKAINKLEKEIELFFPEPSREKAIEYLHQRAKRNEEYKTKYSRRLY